MLTLLPEMAVPMTVKMPEPMTAPMPSAVSDHGPSVFLSACSGSSESRISLSMDLQQTSWLGRSVLLVAPLAGVLPVADRFHSGKRGLRRSVQGEDSPAKKYSLAGAATWPAPGLRAHPRGQLLEPQGWDHAERGDRKILALRLAAHHLLQLLLLRSARDSTLGLGRCLLARRALHFLAFLLVFNLGCVHEITLSLSVDSVCPRWTVRVLW